MTRRSGSRCAQGVIALLALVLAACGNNGNPSDSEKAPTGPSDSAPSSTSPASGTDKVQALKLGSDHREVLAEGRYAVEILYPGPEWQDQVENTSKFGGRLPVAGETASLRYQVDVPDQWEAVDGRGFDAGRPVLAAGDGGNGTLSVLLADFWFPTRPCGRNTLGYPHASVRHLADNFARLRGPVDVSPPAPTKVGGVDALYMTITVPEDADLSACRGGAMLLYDIGMGDIYGMDSVTVDEPGETIRLWIVQIGNSPYVVTTQTGASADPDDVRVLEGMVESITWGRERS